MVQGTNKLLIILGPTAVGKSLLAIKLAKELNGEIISADSMQVYSGMDIGTAKLSKEELDEIPHHLISIIAPSKNWSVSDFILNAKSIIEALVKRGKFPIVVGGTGLYLNALIKGYVFPIIEADKDVRERLNGEAKSYGSLHLYEKLKKIDPDAAANIHPNDLKRVIRALEVYELTGKLMSKMRVKDEENFPYEPVIVGLDMDRKKLYEKIEERVDQMLKAGLVNEVENLIKEGYDEKLTSMQAIGYKEVAEYLQGKYAYEELVSILKQNTRNFAKRQMTWFRRFKNVNWFDIEKLKLGDIIGLIRACD
ncbi:MAG: tRNA (adenosine(37)-N6)-dimethylallyltransferase MiaA [bacterium]